MKLVGTRIRVEKSDIKTEYFPEYCLEYKTWFGFGKPRHTWYNILRSSPYYFGSAKWAADREEYRFTETWAQKIIDYQQYYSKEYEKSIQHEETKETTYVKYP